MGINTTTPNAQLDIVSSDQGVLIPRVELVAINQADPVTTPSGGLPENSTLIYNTATVSGTNGVSPGFYFWKTDKWIPIAGEQSKDWTSTGNLGTDPSENFIGTKDNTAVSIRTNDLERLRISTNNQILAMNGGNQAAPFFSWFSDQNTGIWRHSEDVLSLGSNSTESITINNANNSNRKVIVNTNQTTMDFQVKTSGNANTLNVDGTSNNVGIKTASPQQSLHVAGGNSTIRVEGLNHDNNNLNNAVDPSPVYVNAEGDLALQPPLVQTYMAVNELDFLDATTMSSWSGNGDTDVIYTTQITLTQESLVHINYQFSVSISRYNGDALTDGASRLFRSGVLINGGSFHLGYDTGTYTNNPDSDGGGTFASGFYYLSGNGYAQLPAGTHTISLDVMGFGGSFDFEMVFGETNQDLFQVVVHR
ncbi:MAG TPA: hypothetical protein VFM70_00740 [Salinimicrobium sp.]|nr:hypothetical protein [Salinimicrobium sp.]